MNNPLYPFDEDEDSLTEAIHEAELMDDNAITFADDIDDAEDE